jgi:hypothetical protein
MSTENEILAEVEALKARFSDTKALYREVCALLFFRYGITPTTNKLYQYVRKGTMGTPAEALTKFWDELRVKARVEIDHPDLPPEIKTVAAEAIAAIWQQATAAARSDLAAIRLELQADQERAREQEAQAQAAAEQLRGELEQARHAHQQVQLELETERLAHAGAQARLQQVQEQLELGHAQQRRMQEGFSADLAKAREAVDAAQERAAAAERRALLEIEQERQARSKADKTSEALRGQLAQAESRERQASLEHTEAFTRQQAQLQAAEAVHQAAQAQLKQLEEQVSSLQDRLATSQQQVTRYRTEAETVQGLLERLAPPAVPTPAPAKPTRKKAAKLTLT